MVWKPTKKIVVLVLLIVTALYTVAMIQNFLAYEDWKLQQLEAKHPGDVISIWGYGVGTWISGEVVLWASIGFTLLCKKGSIQ